MREVITVKMLDRVVKRINDAASEEGTTGTFVLDSAYGGWRLEHVLMAGGHEDAMNTGYVPKRALYDAMHIFLRGIQLGRGTK